MTQAVVLGAGMAGLLAARVLSDFFDTVTVVERDTLSDGPAQRPGVPQGKHLHSCLTGGTRILDELFPGILTELADAGAVVVDDGDLSRIYTRLGRYVFRPPGRFADPAALTFILASRPFLEYHVRRRVLALSNVTVLDRHDVIEPVTANGVITGARIVDRGTEVETLLDADLVVEARGRGTRTAALLERMGYPRPQELTSPANWAYSSQFFRIPDGALTEKLILVDVGRNRPRGALVAYEDDTWILTIGRANDTGSPPTDFAGMLAEADAVLPAPVRRGLRHAEPIGPTAVSRSTEGVWRRYDKMAALPKGLLITGDALCSLNPIYGQGMTMAAIEALVLRDCLRGNRIDDFYKGAAKHIAPVWAINQANDRAGLPDRRRTWKRRVQAWTVSAMFRAVERDMTVAEPFFRVNHLIDPPARLRDPVLLMRVLRANLMCLGPRWRRHALP